MAHPHADSSSSSRPTSSNSNNSTSSPFTSHRSPIQKPAAIKTTDSTSSDATHTPRRDPSSLQPSPAVSKRSSFAENLRNYPPSPRTQRPPSFSGAALTELLMSPSTKPNGNDARWRGRDYRTITVGEIIDTAETRFVELDTTIEDTTKLLIRSGAPNVVLIRESTKTKTPIGTFDYSDLNAYLLLVLGLTQLDDLAARLAERARNGEAIPLSDVSDHLGSRQGPAFVPHTANLTHAMEVLGSGLHRVVILKEGTSEAIGILTQLRLVRFFWENHQNFASTEGLYARSLKELELGAKEVLSINGEKPLADALNLMHTEGVTSLPVLDGQRNVVGNISHVDVRLLTDTSSIPLLSASCVHFISIILSERGLFDGKDSYPVFHVTPVSTLAHTVAKLCATRSHRMWIVEAPSPSTSVPPSPGIHHQGNPFQAPTSSASHARHTSITDTASGPNPASGTGQLPGGASMSGRLTGVVSLTDVLNLLARASGLSPGDPEEMRRRRRRSSSSSSRPAIDSIRASAEFLRGNAISSRRSSSASSRK